MHRPVIVTGPGRSGTSTTAKLLHEVFKVKMGDAFHPADEHNQEGYFEDLDFRMLDESLINPQRPQRLLSAPFWEKLTKEALKKKLDEDVPWGYKEPRLSFLLGYHVDLLRGLDVEPVVLWTRRPLHRVAASVHMRRKGFECLWTAFGSVALRDYALQHAIDCMDITCYQFWFYESNRSKVREKIPEIEVVTWIKDCLDKEELEYDRESVREWMLRDEEAKG
jgi:hypothetical protein